MSEYDRYANYHHALDRIDGRVETTQRSRVRGPRRRGAGRRALSRGLHSLADRLDS